MRSAEDRHTVWLTLTEAGHEKLREVWPDHRDSIYLYFGQYLEVAAHNGSVSCFGLRPAGWFSITVPTFVWLVECFAARRARRTGRRGLIGE